MNKELNSRVLNEKVKVKTIVATLAESFDDIINDFIKDKMVIDIKFNYDNYILMAMIMYVEYPF